MTRNADLLRKIADAIEQHPETYDQGTFGEVNSCGTRCCIAGHAMLLNGYPEIVRRRSNFSDSVYYCFRSVNGKEVHSCDADEYAQEMLGLTDHEADVVFEAGMQPLGMTVPQALRKLADGFDVEDCFANFFGNPE